MTTGLNTSPKDETESATSPPIFLAIAPFLAAFLIMRQISRLSPGQKSTAWILVAGAVVLGLTVAWAVDRRTKSDTDGGRGGVWSTTLFAGGYALFASLSHGWPQGLPVLIATLGAFLGATFLFQKFDSGTSASRSL